MTILATLNSSAFGLLFEVMDKELSLEFIWLFFLIFGVIGFFLARKHPALLLVSLPLPVLVAWLHVSELWDPMLGPDIAREAGPWYFIQSYAAIFFGLAFPLLGSVAWFRRWVLDRKPGIAS